MAEVNGNALQAQQDADRLAASFTTMMINGPSGFTMPGFLGGGGTGAASNLAAGSLAGRYLPVIGPGPVEPGGKNPIGGAPPTSVTPPGGNPITVGGGTGTGGATVNISILQNGTVADAQGVTDAIPSIVAAVNQGQYNAMRRVGTYQSVTT